MSTKMKGLLKGLKYISTIFEEEKEEEFQIGNPTDVKHVAHIGGDGPAVETPSWMKEFTSSSTAGFSAPLGPPSDSKENPEIKWVSEDSKRGQKGDDQPGVPRSSRRNNSDNNSNDSSPRKQKTRQSRRQGAKDSSDKSASQESTSSIPNIPRKSRQKKSNGGEAKTTRSSRPKAASNDSDNDNSRMEIE